MGNVLGLRAPVQAAALFSAMVDLALPEEAQASSAERIFALMAAHRVTFYDAVYHALAVERGGTMVTRTRRCASAHARRRK